MKHLQFQIEKKPSDEIFVDEMFVNEIFVKEITQLILV